MARYYERNDSGYTRGGLDVVTGINLFFKGILIFPILVLATYIGLALVKHMIFQGVPNMNAPTQEQRERLIEQDQRISQSNSLLPESENRGYETENVEIPSQSSTSGYASNCQYSPVCPPGGENRVGANGLPYQWPTATPIGGWNTEIQEDPFN